MKKSNGRKAEIKATRSRRAQKGLIRETRGGEPYEYYPLGQYIVAAPGICGGRPTFKYTRIEVAFVLDLLAAGWTMEQVGREYAESEVSAAAVQEAIELAKRALVGSSSVAELQAA